MQSKREDANCRERGLVTKGAAACQQSDGAKENFAS